jgi:STE24 endopeptidase
MNPQLIFYIIIGILVFNFILDKIVDGLNAKHFNDQVPLPINDVYNDEDYKKSQRYKKENYNFGLLTSTFSIIATLLFFFFDGFAVLDEFARSFSENEVIVGLIFFGCILFISDLVSTPFGYYKTFVIEEKYGFNKTNTATFFLDKLKGWLLMGLLGGGILALLIWFYQETSSNFWLYAWGLITIFSIFMNMFYARLIVPIFNKQTPLEEGSLRDKIEAYANKVGFTLKNIFVIDGSKRSTKANAYFSGFGTEKRITLYDTLIHDLEDEEIVAVLAHEVGHYKKKHIIVNLITSVITTGIMLWLLSLFIGNPLLSKALDVSQPSFHIGLIAFGVLYSPFSEIIGMAMNYISRTFEYQADNYAKETYKGSPLISALKKLSKNSLSNLTPHPVYVFMHYSHPTLLERYQNLKK